MSVNVKNFNVKVPTKVNTRAEFCDKKSIFGSLCILRMGTELVMQMGQLDSHSHRGQWRAATVRK